jgi:hypothetical protein
MIAPLTIAKADDDPDRDRSSRSGDPVRISKRREPAREPGEFQAKELGLDSRATET